MHGSKQILLSLDGNPVPHTQALGWQWAYGCFETFLWKEGHTLSLDKHLLRFNQGYRELLLDSPFDIEELEERITEALEPFASRPMRVRLEGVLDDSGLMSGGAPPFVMRVGLRVAETSPTLPIEDFNICLLNPIDSKRLRPMPAYKPLNYGIRLRLRNRILRAGFYEAMVSTEDLRIVSGLTSNLFVRTGHGTWMTPPVDCGCLPGVTRRLLLDSDTPESVVERDIHLHDLSEATAALVTNSVIGVQPIHQIWIEEGVVREYEAEPSEAMAEWYDGLLSKDSPREGLR